MWAVIDALADEFLRADETAAASLLRDPEQGSDTEVRDAEERDAEEGWHAEAGGDGTVPRRRGVAAARADALVGGCQMLCVSSGSDVEGVHCDGDQGRAGAAA